MYFRKIIQKYFISDFDIIVQPILKGIYVILHYFSMFRTLYIIPVRISLKGSLYFATKSDVLITSSYTVNKKKIRNILGINFALS